MSNLLDLKHKKGAKTESEEHESVLKQVEKTLPIPLENRGPIPMMITWSGPLYYHAPNGRLLAGFLVVLYATGIFFIFFQKNIFAATFFLLGATLLLITSRKKPPVVAFVVGPLSIKMGSQEYKFSDIKSFWIEYNPDSIKELSLQLKKWYRPYIKIPLMNEDPIQISAILLKFIPEVEHHDSIIDSFSRLLGV